MLADHGRVHPRATGSCVHFDPLRTVQRNSGARIGRRLSAGIDTVERPTVGDGRVRRRARQMQNHAADRADRVDPQLQEPVAQPCHLAASTRSTRRPPPRLSSRLDVRAVRPHPIVRRGGAPEQPRLEPRIVQLRRQRPAQPLVRGPLQIQRHRAHADRAGLARIMREGAVEGETQEPPCGTNVMYTTF